MLLTVCAAMADEHHHPIVAAHATHALHTLELSVSAHAASVAGDCCPPAFCSYSAPLLSLSAVAAVSRLSPLRELAFLAARFSCACMTAADADAHMEDVERSTVSGAAQGSSSTSSSSSASLPPPPRSADGPAEVAAAPGQRAAEHAGSVGSSSDADDDDDEDDGEGDGSEDDDGDEDEDANAADAANDDGSTKKAKSKGTKGGVGCAQASPPHLAPRLTLPPLAADSLSAVRWIPAVCGSAQSSCHQCKSRRNFVALTYCCATLDKKNKRCRKVRRCSRAAFAAALLRLRIADLCHRCAPSVRLSVARSVALWR